jgi:drug/metabolite transporter (DMT)-like permease
VTVGTLVAALASFCLKKSSGGVGVVSILRDKMFFAGGFLYVLSSVITMWLLQRMPYSVILPMGGICYIWILLISYRFLGEKINTYKIMGIILIIVGVVFLAR